MSISSAMNTAVSALKSQSQNLSVISNNLANSSTTGYKSVSTSFSALVTQQFSGNNYNGAGVTSSSRQNVSNQGKIEATANNSDLALDGNGMFVVRAGTDNSSIYFSRNGEFDVDKDGYIVNGNFYLMGWPTDETGALTVDPSTSDLQKINVTKDVSSVAETTKSLINANLNPNVEVGDLQNTTMEVYDSLGNLHTLKLTWEKTNPGEWNLTVTNPDGSGGPETTIQALTFDGKGNLTSPTAPASFDLPLSWDDGADPSTITVDLSTVRQNFSSPDKTKVVDQSSVNTDGHGTGKLLGVAIDKQGTVTATYDNGESIPIYRIAVATFPNYDGLSALSHGVYQASSTSGDYTLHFAGDGGAATISSSTLEASTVDTADEFTRMIVAQQAYSAASQVITTAKDMYDSLIGAVR